MDATREICSNLLLPEEEAQIEAIREAVKARRPAGRGAAQALQFAMEDALDGILCLAHNSLGLAPSNFEDAAKCVRKAVAQA